MIPKEPHRHNRMLGGLWETDLVTATSQGLVGRGEVYIKMGIKDKPLNVIGRPGLDLDLDKKHVKEMYTVIRRCTLTSWAWALDAEAYEGGHDWSLK